MLIKMLNQLRGADAPEHGYDVTALHSFSSLETAYSDIEEMFSHIDTTADISSLARVTNSGTLEPVSSLEEAIADNDFKTHIFTIRGNGRASGNVAVVIYDAEQRHFELMWAHLTEAASNILRGKLIAANGQSIYKFKDNIDGEVYFKEPFDDIIEDVDSGDIKHIKNIYTYSVKITTPNLDNYFVDLNEGVIMRIYGGAAVESTDVVSGTYDDNSCKLTLVGDHTLSGVTAGTTDHKGTGNYKKRRVMVKIAEEDGDKLREFVSSRVLYALSRNLSYTSLSECTYEVDHIDNDSCNNNIANLQLVTARGNGILKKVRKALEALNDNEEDLI